MEHVNNGHDDAGKDACGSEFVSRDGIRDQGDGGADLSNMFASKVLHKVHDGERECVCGKMRCVNGRDACRGMRLNAVGHVAGRIHREETQWI